MNTPTFVLFVCPLKMRGSRQFQQNLSITSFQHGVLESRFTWMYPEHPCGPGCRQSVPA